MRVESMVMRNLMLMQAIEKADLTLEWHFVSVETVTVNLMKDFELKSLVRETEV